MSKYVSLSNLARYDGKLQPLAQNACAIKNAPDAMWRQTEEAGAVSFWPVGNSPLEGTVEFMFKETPPASGDKSPTNPSTIAGVSSVRVTRCGKNLLPSSANYYSGNTTYADVDFTVQTTGGVVADGTSTGQTTYSIMSGSTFIPIFEGQKLFLSGCPSGGGTSTYYVTAITYDSSKAVLNRYFDFSSGASITVSSSEKYIRVAIVIKSGIHLSNVLFRPQLEIGTSATSFEDWLPSVANVSFGDTYYGGSIDLSTGLMTVTHACVRNTPNGSVSAGIHGDLAWCYLKPGIAIKADNSSLRCNRFVTSDTNGIERVYCRTDSYTSVNCIIQKSRLDFSSAANPSSPTDAEVKSAFDAWLEENPVDVAFKLYTPYTVQLTPPQIRALSQPDKYVPRLNTVYTDADAVQIVYQKNPVRDKFEKVQAIIAQGGNV